MRAQDLVLNVTKQGHSDLLYGIGRYNSECPRKGLVRGQSVLYSFWSLDV